MSTSGAIHSGVPALDLDDKKVWFFILEEAEIAHFHHPVFVHQKVGGFQVAVDDDGVAAVCILRDVQRHAHATRLVQRRATRGVGGRCNSL